MILRDFLPIKIYFDIPSPVELYVPNILRTRVQNCTLLVIVNFKKEENKQKETEVGSYLFLTQEANS